MSETRYIETYEQGTGKLLSREPFEVSDEELIEEVRAKRTSNILQEVDDLKARVERLEKKWQL